MHKVTISTVAVTLAVAAICEFAFAAKTQAATVLDQYSTAPTKLTGWAIGDRNAQTVTVGVTGILDRVEVRIYQSDAFANGDLLIELFALDAQGHPDRNALLGSSLITNANIPTSTLFANTHDYTPADFSGQGLFFNRGDQFAIVPRRTPLSNWGTPPWMVWNGAGTTSSYADGTFYLEDKRTGEWEARDGAHAFRTFVSTVPEPNASLALSVIGASAFRRRTRVDS